MGKIDVSKLYEEIRRRYQDMGYPVSGDRLVLSSVPTYTDGREVPAGIISPNSSGGNAQDDGTIRINPEYRKVMQHWKLKGSGPDFLKTIIGHELGHHIDRTYLSSPGNESVRRKILDRIRENRFHTVYTDSYGKDTDPRKMDKELLAEYLSHKVTGKVDW